MSDRYPLTISQFGALQTDLAGMLAQSEGIFQLLKAAYGDFDQKVVRAGELKGAVHRLITELDRSTSPRPADPPEAIKP
jgi:hypothetical protein